MDPLERLKADDPGAPPGYLLDPDDHGVSTLVDDGTPCLGPDALRGVIADDPGPGLDPQS